MGTPIEEERGAHEEEGNEEDTTTNNDHEQDKCSIRTLLAMVNRKRDTNQKIKLDWDPIGRPCGENRANFMSYIGISTRSRVNINYSRWPRVPNHIKEAIWVDVSGAFDVPPNKKKWLISQASERFRGFKSHLTTTCVYDKDGNIISTPPTTYTFITQQMWDDFIESRQTPEFKLDSKKHRDIVSKNEYAYKGSRKGYSGIQEDMIKEIQKEQSRPSSASKIIIPRHELWIAARTPKTGILDEKTKKVADEMENMSQQASQGEVNFSERQDILATVLGKKEHPGRVRAAGVGVRITQYFPKLNEQKVNDLEAEVLLLQRQVGKLQKSLDEVHKDNKETPNASIPDIEFPEGWTSCFLASEEVSNPIVAIGKVFNTSDIKSVMIHCKPLQLGNLKVEVVQAEAPEAPLPVPTVEASIVSDAVKSYVEWPKCLIFLQLKS